MFALPSSSVACCSRLSCCAGLTAAFDIHQLADKGDNVHSSRNQKIHTDDEQLRKDARFLLRRKYVAAMQEEMPYECALVTELDWIVKNMCELS